MRRRRCGPTSGESCLNSCSGFAFGCITCCPGAKGARAMGQVAAKLRAGHSKGVGCQRPTNARCIA
eukprot:5720184-Pyramimonas_sp.AAC.1